MLPPGLEVASQYGRVDSDLLPEETKRCHPISNAAVLIALLFSDEVKESTMFREETKHRTNVQR